MKINLLSLLIIMSIFCSVLYIMEPISAASSSKGYLIDHGTSYDTLTFDVGDEPLYVKKTWKTYRYKHSIKVFITFYYKEGGKWKNSSTKYGGYHKMNFLIKKASKSKIKIIQTVKLHGKVSWFAKTKSNARNYYWNKFRREWVAFK